MPDEQRTIDWGGNLLDGLPYLDASMLDELRRTMRPPEPVFTSDELATLAAFVRASGIKPEGTRPFDLSEHRHLAPLYQERRDDPFRRVVVMKSAQMGLTIRLLNRALWWVSDARRMVNAALLFPSRDAVTELSATRFRPMLRSSAPLMELAKDVDRVDVVRVGRSNMRFRGMRSGISMDSFPSDVLLFDEVRLMSTQTINRTLVRASESTIRGPDGTRGLIELNSTAGFPGMDIHKWFERSTMGYWHTRCPDEACPLHKGGIPLPKEFAEDHNRVVGQSPSGRFYLRCPRCGARILNPQDGFYEHEAPDAVWTGYQFSQLLKGEDFLNTTIMPDFLQADNIPEFYNSRLGLPYEDRDAVPASREVVLRNRDGSQVWRWPTEPLGYDNAWRAIGVDQRAGEKHVTIKTLLPDGRHRLDWVEVIEASGDEAVERLVAATLDWGCKVMVMDGEPSYDLFVSIARQLKETPCQVWLQDYVDGVPNIVRWEDKRDDKTLRRSSGELKWERRALVDRFKALDWSLGLFKLVRNVLPVDVTERVQSRRVAGREQPVSVGDEWISHMGNLAKVRLPKLKTDAKTGERFEVVGEYVQAWRNLRLDPHFAHANLYADLGLKMMHGTTRAFGAGKIEDRERVKQEELGIPAHLAPSRLKQEAKRAWKRTCGNCAHFQAGEERCGHPAHKGKFVHTTADMPACTWPGWRRRKRDQ